MRAKEFTEPSAAGCILYAEDTGRWGLQQRSDSVDDPGLWAAWGGGREPGETLEQTARRELAEESGYRGPITLEPLARNAKYVTFVGIVPHEFEPRPCDEWKDYCWVELGRWPTPMHPGVAAALENVYIKENTEFVDVDKIHQAGLREHLLSNPSLYENREDFANLRKFLSLHSTAEPQVGKNYVYCSVQATPIANYISVACFGQPHRLVKIKDHVAYFEFDGKIRRFPETGSLSGDAMSQIYFFNSNQEFSNFNTMMQLKFSNHKYNYKNLDSDAYVKENFTEAFNKPYKGKWEKSESGSYDMLARLPDGTNLSIMFNNEGGGEWQVEFYRNNSQEVTGEGDAQRIFATVLGAIQTFIKKHNPLQITFSASKEVEPGQNSESRAKLYNRLVDRYAASWGYDTRTFEHGNAVSYELSKYPSDGPFESVFTENFADGKVKGKSRPGRVKRSGASCSGSVTDLRAKAKKYGGEKGKMYHWCANMKGGKK